MKKLIPLFLSLLLLIGCSGTTTSKNTSYIKPLPEEEPTRVEKVYQHVLEKKVNFFEIQQPKETKSFVIETYLAQEGNLELLFQNSFPPELLTEGLSILGIGILDNKIVTYFEDPKNPENISIGSNEFHSPEFIDLLENKSEKIYSHGFLQEELSDIPWNEPIVLEQLMASSGNELSSSQYPYLKDTPINKEYEYIFITITFYDYDITEV